MKKIIFSIFVLALTLSACEDEASKGVSRITTYATMELKGAADIFWPLNTPFVDPGIVALEGTTDISSKITKTTSLDVSKGGMYTISYKVLNADGFPATATRNVIVYDASAPYNGYYQSKIARTYNGALLNRGPYKLLVFGVGSGNYYVESLLGGWYSIGSGYGAAYAGPGTIKINTDNTISIVTASKLAWGYPCLLTAGTTSTADPVAKTLVLNTNMEDVPTMKFAVTLSSPTPLN